MKDIYEILKDKGYEIPSSLQSYYSTSIQTWKDWWKGYIKKVHEYQTSNVRKEPITLKRKSLKMAKKVSEDWANLLLNDKTYITVDDEPSQEFLTGEETEQSGGVLGKSKFWKIGNQSVEKAYALGTVAFILNLEKPVVKGTKLFANGVKINAIKDASKIIPLSYSETEIFEIAVYSHLQQNGKKYIYLQIFKQLNEGEYEISNDYYEETGIGYVKVENLKGEVNSYKLPCKPFFVLTPAIENNILDDVPMGISCYANAEDELAGCDIAFDNLYVDFILGRKKVFMSQSMLATERIVLTDNEGEPILDAQGKPKIQIVPLTGESVEQTLYCNLGEHAPGEKAAYEEYNPTLRVEEGTKGIQTFLNLLSSKVGFGQQRYKFDMVSMNTATEVRVSNKDLTESVWKQRINIQDVLIEMTKSILILGKEKCGVNCNPEAKITIDFDDSMFTDEEAQRLNDLQEVREGVMAKWEYRVKYYGEDEEKAKKMLKEIEEPEEKKTGFFDA